MSSLEEDDEATRLRQELAEIATPGDAKCAICQATRRRHRQLEEAGELHHHFSETGELRHAAPTPKQKRVPTTPDLVLRMALLNRGLITAEDLIRAEMMLRDAAPAGQPAAVPGGQGRPDRGDRPDREAESSGGGVRSDAAGGGAVQGSVGVGNAQQE